MLYAWVNVVRKLPLTGSHLALLPEDIHNGLSRAPGLKEHKQRRAPQSWPKAKNFKVSVMMARGRRKVSRFAEVKSGGATASTVVTRATFSAPAVNPALSSCPATAAAAWRKRETATAV
jgi:hypothetical protein